MLLTAVAEAYLHFAAYKQDPRHMFLKLLRSLLHITDSAFGFIGKRRGRVGAVSCQ